ncbi:hypothetical protein QVD17_04968 [Tagetes erecta]|uniref:Uncharacterized protein n=1 Tax=Tagetes erecta TaxID=13708 RepID=A0AAD8LDM2_TARER|nr:hypothetical protein QVD17_04968 [Tagetes erecta]
MVLIRLIFIFNKNDPKPLNPSVSPLILPRVPRTTTHEYRRSLRYQWLLFRHRKIIITKQDLLLSSNPNFSDPLLIRSIHLKTSYPTIYLFIRFKGKVFGLV